MKKLYCPDCGEYLEGGNGNMTDCACGFKQPAEPVEAAPDHDTHAEALREENRVLKNALNFCERAAVHHAKTLPASDIVGMIAHHPTIQDITRGYGETPPEVDPVTALREEIAKLKDSLRHTIEQVIFWQEYATGCEQEETEEMKTAKELIK